VVLGVLVSGMESVTASRSARSARCGWASSANTFPHDGFVTKIDGFVKLQQNPEHG